jgi:hypothetical protein
MKAEHRKELQTNLLADRMGRLVQGIKAGPRSSSAFAWVTAVLVVIVVVGYYLARIQNARQSAEWIRLLHAPSMEARDPAAYYASVARQSAGTLPGRTARFQEARILLNRGLTTYYSSATHGQAVKDLRDAGKLYQDLLGESQGNAVLEQEALLGAARVEETLSAEPNPDNPDAKLGSLDRALTYYQRLADNYPKSTEGETAKKRVEDLTDAATKARMEEFYAKLAGSLKKPESTPLLEPGGQIPPPLPPTP